jgi:hypothetical protein
VLDIKIVCSISMVRSTIFVPIADHVSLIALRETRHY